MPVSIADSRGRLVGAVLACVGTCVAGSVPAHAQTEWPSTLVPVDRILLPEINESSGIVHLNGAFFTHNDSGDEPRLFRSVSMDFDEAEILPLEGASAVDWEEITTIDGDLLVCDIGDNGRSRNDLMLYRAHYESGTLTLTARYPIAYPDASHDAEAAAVIDGHLYVVSKAREDRVTNVYRFEELIDEANLTAGRKNVPELVSQLDIGEGEQVTAGTYDPHTGTLILLTYSGILQYPKDRLSGEPDKTTQIVARQCEAICLVDDTLVVTNEQRDVFALPGFLDYPVTKLLPPRAHIALPRTPMNIPLSGALPGERLLWWTESDSLVVTGRFQSKDDAIPMGQAAPRVGTCVLLMFARDPSWWVSDTDTQIGIGIDEQGVVALWRVKLRGTPTATRLSAGRVRGRFVDSVLLFETRIPMTSLFTEAVPDTFLFDVQGIRLHGADEEPYFSAPGNFSAYRPYAWGTASLAP